LSNPDRSAYGTSQTKPLLVIEVADSSLEYDLGEKSALYAAAEVPEYFRAPWKGSYRARIAPTAWPDLELDVSSLFPEGGSVPSMESG
jgi:Putative restriction endonuclease